MTEGGLTRPQALESRNHPRTAFRPVAIGASCPSAIASKSTPVLGGLHHEYRLEREAAQRRTEFLRTAGEHPRHLIILLLTQPISRLTPMLHTDSLRMVLLPASISTVSRAS